MFKRSIGPIWLVAHSTRSWSRRPRIGACIGTSSPLRSWRETRDFRPREDAQQLKGSSTRYSWRENVVQRVRIDTLCIITARGRRAIRNKLSLLPSPRQRWYVFFVAVDSYSLTDEYCRPLRYQAQMSSDRVPRMRFSLRRLPMWLHSSRSVLSLLPTC